MPLTDSEEIRESLTHLFPSIQIERAIPTASGQRLVYFCTFGESEIETQKGWTYWGKTVLKISEDIHPSVIARLDKEVEILNSLKDAPFPTIYFKDVFSEDPVTEIKFPYRRYITIENRIDGEPLSNCLDRFSSERDVAKLLRSLISALLHLWEHPQKIIHRDLKPDNILITSNNGVVIIDLGIVRQEGSVGITQTFQQFGPCTFAYASPEQLRNEKSAISYKSDLFALGVIAYQLISKKHPFIDSMHDPIEQLYERVLELTPPTLADLSLCSTEFSDIINKLMEKQAYARFRRPADILELLDKLIGE